MPLKESNRQDVSSVNTFSQIQSDIKTKKNSRANNFIGYREAEN